MINEEEILILEKEIEKIEEQLFYARAEAEAWKRNKNPNGKDIMSKIFVNSLEKTLNEKIKELNLLKKRD